MCVLKCIYYYFLSRSSTYNDLKSKDNIIYKYQKKEAGFCKKCYKYSNEIAIKSKLCYRCYYDI